MGIGPSTKETTLHHFRDPLLEVVSKDTDVDLMGIILVGSPDGNEEKMLVGTRAAVWAECMRADGVIFSCDGWGNSHVDYTNTMEQIGSRGIPATGITFNGNAAQFVVMNEYLEDVIDINKSATGDETNVLGENNMTERDCKLALAKLKLRMRQKDLENK
ncbi:glycine/sarcosine/betaine reductase component B subunit [Acetivibrio ethanolgignens]|uniref:Proline reductase n=1 Tax=Acetivibrio ethanolgignens TaxID=290052 RepID=A0A0V8QER9_9FIRM|nr:glycine/sarcosine/betaine reductase component B subunit [Acetivibrio ethanolgignens]KSV58883.1 proline reductase [Acetivibrio ethanolgignens]